MVVCILIMQMLLSSYTYTHNVLKFSRSSVASIWISLAKPLCEMHRKGLPLPRKVQATKKMAPGFIVLVGVFTAHILFPKKGMC